MKLARSTFRRTYNARSRPASRFIEPLGREIRALELVIHREVRLRAEFEILKTTPGIGDILAAMIMLETGTVARFPGAGQAARTAAALRDDA